MHKTITISKQTSQCRKSKFLISTNQHSNVSLVISLEKTWSLQRLCSSVASGWSALSFCSEVLPMYREYTGRGSGEASHRRTHWRTEEEMGEDVQGTEDLQKEKVKLRKCRVKIAHLVLKVFSQFSAYTAVQTLLFSMRYWCQDWTLS